MLVEVQKVNRAYRDLQGLLISQIQQEYQKTPAARAKKVSVVLAIASAYPQMRRLPALVAALLLPAAQPVLLWARRSLLPPCWSPKHPPKPKAQKLLARSLKQSP